jgi:hypothetical protein
VAARAESGYQHVQPPATWLPLMRNENVPDRIPLPIVGRSSGGASPPKVRTRATCCRLSHRPIPAIHALGTSFRSPTPAAPRRPSRTSPPPELEPSGASSTKSLCVQTGSR